MGGEEAPQGLPSPPPLPSQAPPSAPSAATVPPQGLYRRKASSYTRQLASSLSSFFTPLQRLAQAPKGQPLPAQQIEEEQGDEV
jgi:hypothetical protein